MKKILPLCLACVLSSASIYAQNALNNNFSKRPIANGKTELVGEKSELKRVRITPFETEAPQMTNNELSLIPTLADVWASSFSCVSGFSYATHFNENLTARFKGNNVTSLFTVFPECASSVEIWFRKEINGVNVWSTTVSNLDSSNTNTIVEIGCNYTLDGDPLYVGYTVTVNPLAFSPKAQVFYSKEVSDTYSLLIDFNTGSGWSNYSSGMGSLFIGLKTDGANGLKDYDICFSYLDASTRAKSGEIGVIKGEVTNYGAYKATSLNGNIDGEEWSVALPDTLGFMETAEITIEKVAQSTPGRYTQKYELTNVNGQPDTYADNTQSNTFISIGNPYDRVAVMETLTDIDEGWCPAAIVAHEEAQKEFQDKYIGIDIHGYTGSRDPFMTTSYKQLYDLGFVLPVSIFNRNYMTYPDYGYDYVKQYINDVISTPSEAQIDITSTLSDDKKTIELEAIATFGLDCEATPYSIAYVLTEDALTATQANYFSNQYASQTGLKLSDLPLEFIPLWNQAGTYNATFNNVARDIYNCWGIENSLTGKISNGEAKNHKLSISTPSTIANFDKVNVIALLFDNESGEIVTAAKAKLGETSVGIEDINSDDAQNDAQIMVTDGCINVNASNAIVTIYNINGQVVASANIANNGTISTEGLNGVHIIKVCTNNNTLVKKIIL